MYFPSVSDLCRKAQYKWDYLCIDARLRYYSNSSNPRVIHTKLKNQPLLSLRTYPHDKYLVKPGEFLTLAKRGDPEEDVLDFLDHYNEATLAVQVVKGSVGSAEREKAALMGSEEYWKTHEPEKYNHSFWNPRAALVHTDAMVARVVGQFRRREELVDVGQESLAPSECSNAQNDKNEAKCNCDARAKCKACRGAEVWRTVISDVLLLAARLSTGSEGTARDDYENLSCDLTELKRKDVFAENYKQGRERWGSMIPPT